MQEFDESSLKAKVSNMMVQLLIAITKENLDDVLHFLKEQPREYAKSIINKLQTKKVHQVFDELNISSISLGFVEEKDNALIYSAIVNTKSLNYKVDNNNNIVEGNNSYRTDKTYYLKLIKNKHTKEGIVLRCPSCGHSMDVNYSGKCPYCDSIFNQEDYDYQILEIKE